MPRNLDRRAIVQGGIIACLWLLYLVVIHAIYTTHPDGAGDYIAYDRAARALNTGRPLYSGIYGDKPYIYPPLLAILLAPISAVLDIRGAAVAWLAVNIILLIVMLNLIAPTLPSRHSRLLLWSFPLVYTPVIMSFWHGQATILMGVLVIGAWVSHRKDRRGLAGALLATGTWVKIFPVVLIAYFCWKRDWTVVKGALIAGVGLGVFQWLVAGTENAIAFVTTVLPGLAASGQTTIYHAHVGIVGFAARLFTPVDYVQPLVESPALFWLTRISLTILVIGADLFLTRHKSPAADDAIFDLEYVLVLTSALLLMSAIADSGLVSLILTFAVLFYQQRSRRTLRIACLLAFLLSPIDLIIRLGYLTSPDVRASALLLSTSFFSGVILWCASAYGLIRARAEHPIA